jgi:predicted lactoylglutathione lyase
MTKLLGPDFISLQVRNLSASRMFYLALSEAKVNLDEAPQPGWGVALWIDCDQVNELHAKLAAAGATIITPPYDGPFGRTFVFADPDGYRLTANENPWDRFPLGGRRQGE